MTEGGWSGMRVTAIMQMTGNIKLAFTLSILMWVLNIGKQEFCMRTPDVCPSMAGYQLWLWDGMHF